MGNGLNPGVAVALVVSFGHAVGDGDRSYDSGKVSPLLDKVKCIAAKLHENV